MPVHWRSSVDCRLKALSWHLVSRSVSCGAAARSRVRCDGWRSAARSHRSSRWFRCSAASRAATAFSGTAWTAKKCKRTVRCVLCRQRRVMSKASAKATYTLSRAFLSPQNPSAGEPRAPAKHGRKPFDATEFGPPCPQVDINGVYIGHEDCLTLNVWSARRPPRRPRRLSRPRARVLVRKLRGARSRSRLRRSPPRKPPAISLAEPSRNRRPRLCRLPTRLVVRNPRSTSPPSLRRRPHAV